MPTTIIDYTYEDLKEGIDSIAKQIQDSNMEFDYIVGIVRGGAVPAVMLSHKLKIPVQMVHWSTRDKPNSWPNEHNAWIPDDLINGKCILLVDDIVDGGETIQELLRDWDMSIYDAMPSENIRVCSLIYNTAQDTIVNYYHRTIDRNEDKRWFVFPWES